MANRIPDRAFEDYFGQGANRSYQELADRYGVSKRAVVKRATQERWQERVRERDEKTMEVVASKVEETIESLNSRHLRVLKAIQAKALEALKALPMTTAMDAVRSLEITIRQERLIHGEPTDRGDVTALIKQEHERWMES